MSMLVARRADKFATPLGCRAVHWFHNPKQYDRPRDQFEWEDLKTKKEFGHSRVTDHDRHPHYYMELSKGRGWLTQAFDIKHWKFSKDWYANLGRDKVARMRRFKKIDTMDFLEKIGDRYVWLPDDADGAMGFISDEDDDPITDSPEFGLAYSEATPDYRERVLKDRCNGRPTFEWQLPFGTHVIHGYNEVLTAVDVVGNEDAAENTSFRWKEASGGVGHHMEDSQTGRKLVIADLEECPDLLKSFKPDTVILPYGADKTLNSVHSTFASSGPDERYGCFVLGMWSILWFSSPFYPLGVVGSLTTGLLAGLNALCIQRTFASAEDKTIKKVMAAIRAAKIETVVMGDWLDEDYHERIFHTSVNDRAVVERITNPDKSLVLAEKRQTIYSDPHISPAGKSIRYLMAGAPFGQHLGRSIQHLIPSWEKPPETSMEKVMSTDYPSTYRDAINLKRTDVLTHVTNNSPGEKILLCLRPIDNVPVGVVKEMLRRKLQSTLHDVGSAQSSQLPAHRVAKIPFLFDEAYERVEVVF